MEIQTGDHWTNLLKAAAITMNFTFKRAHGQTPFKVMWGRESRHQDLLSTINNLQCNTEEDFAIDDAIMSEVIPPLDDIEEISDIFSPPLEIPQEEVTSIDESRTSTKQSAMDSINCEQIKQKMQYDKKVNEGRLVELYRFNNVFLLTFYYHYDMCSASLKMDDKIVYTHMPKLKHLPKTKKQSKYIGPYTVSKVTDSHVTISQTELGAKKDKKIPIHITRPYFVRNTKKKVNFVLA